MIQASPGAVYELVRYDRDAIRTGEFWRLLSGHLAHLGWSHLAMNVAGLLLISWLFAPRGQAWLWSAYVLVCTFLTGIGLYVLSPQIIWYVGLSGVLHGLIVVGAFRWIMEGDRMGYAVLAVIAFKIGWEQVFGALPLSQAVAGGPIAIDAHLWGSIAGLLVGILILIAGRQGRRV